MMVEPSILRPFNRAEAISTKKAARIAGKSQRTIREWCVLYDIGRLIAGQWHVSKVALSMHLDGDKEALAAYLRGDRGSPAVVRYFAQQGVPLRT